MASRAGWAAVLGLLAPGCATESQSQWELVWRDEFSGTRLDTTRWRLTEDCWGGGNAERQCYGADAVRMADGILTITARSEVTRGSAQPDGRGATVARNFSSGQISTRGRAAWQDCRIRVRARLPQGQGMWPAIWMLPETHQRGVSPLTGEIDIAEAVNLLAACEGCAGGREHRILGALHFAEPGGSRERSGAVALEDPTAFHIYEVEWSQAAITWRIDGRTFHRVESRAWRKAENRPFNQPYHLILNLAVGGRWPERENEKGIDGRALPATMAVDWVRVYRASDPDPLALRL